MTASTLNPMIQARAQATGDLVGALQAKDYDAALNALSREANVSYTTEDGRSLLYDAVVEKDLTAVKLLLAWGAEVNVPNGKAFAPLFAALSSGMESITKLLLDAGADPWHVDDQGRKAERFLTNEFATEWGNAPLTEMIQQYRDLPRIDPTKSIGNLKERLFAFGNNDYAPLDNPQVWRQFDRIAASLAEAGTPIEKDDWLSPNARGERWVDVALRFQQFGTVVEQMHTAGEQFELEELVQEDGSATPFLKQIVEQGGIRHLFRIEQFEDGGMQDFRRLRAAVPEEALTQVRNFHVLQSTLSRATPEREYRLQGR